MGRVPSTTAISFVAQKRPATIKEDFTEAVAEIIAPRPWPVRHGLHGAATANALHASQRLSHPELQPTGIFGLSYATSLDVAHFQDDPVTFAQQNIVIIPELQHKKYGEQSPAIFCLYEWHARASTKGKVYRISTMPDNVRFRGQKIPAYFCDYSHDACPSIKVGREANLLLTPMLSGCSIGVRPEYDGGITICHANARSAEDQVDRQEDDIYHCLGKNATIIHPRDYRIQDGDSATMIGVLKNGTWNISFSTFSGGMSLGNSRIYNNYGFTRAVQMRS